MYHRWNTKSVSNRAKRIYKQLFLITRQFWKTSETVEFTAVSAFLLQKKYINSID
jgi:hypothetical protein